MLDLAGKNLVVVDMQPDYEQSLKVLDAVEFVVRKAVLAQSLVVFLEFGGERTWVQLRDCVQRYDLSVTAQKYRCDGSPEVLAACARGQFDMDSFVIVGVDANICVAATADGIARSLSNNVRIEVAMDACASHGMARWDQFPVGPNIELVAGL